jgi:GNAT superfamily N-acetyltransferase
MRMERLNPADEQADLEAVLPVYRQYFAEMQPGFPLPGAARLRFWASEGYRGRTRCYGLFADEKNGPALALAVLSYDLDDNRDLAYGFFAVPAALHDREAGAFLVREALRIAAAEGRPRLCTDGSDKADPTEFLTGLGGRMVSTTTRSVLDLAGVDPARYEAWAAASERNAGYRLVRWIDRCPDELAESFCQAMDAMQDAPMEDFEYKHPKATLERLRAEEEHSARFGVQRYVQAAVDADGTVAGFSIFITTPGEPEVVNIWDTAVIRTHRGHGLGLRIKAAATLWMLQALPQARWVHTFNNHGNSHMLDVNLTMGYRKSEDWYGFEFATGA